MNELYPFEKNIKFNASNRTIHIDTNNSLEAQEVKEKLKETDDHAKRWPHKRPASVNYFKPHELVKYSVNVSNSEIEISGNDLSDIIAALDDLNSLDYITKAKRDDLVLQIDKSEDTPERKAKIKAEVLANIKARRKQEQQAVSAGNGSQLLMPPKKSLPSDSNSIIGYYQNGNTHSHSTKPPIK